ncbi:MAG: hypothetical protein ACN6QA_25755, partial [Cupriavidus sp.]
MTVSSDLKAHRERLVLDHFADETRQDFDAVLATFPHPHFDALPCLTAGDSHTWRCTSASENVQR